MTFLVSDAFTAVSLVWSDKLYMLRDLSKYHVLDSYVLGGKKGTEITLLLAEVVMQLRSVTSTTNYAIVCDRV